MNNDYINVKKFMKMKSKHRAGRKQKTQKYERLVLQKKVKNADLCKIVLNKIKTADEKCVKYNFVAPLTFLIRKTSSDQFGT